MNGGKVHGGPEMIAKLRLFAKKYPKKIGSATYQLSQEIMTESKKRCPVWDPAVPIPAGHVPGSLRASGYVSPPQYEGGRIFCILSYGGGAVTYAIYVHENPDVFHAIGQWKYLQSVIDEYTPFIGARIAVIIHLDKIKLEDL